MYTRYNTTTTIKSTGGHNPVFDSTKPTKPQQRERERDTELIHSRHNFSKRVLALLQRAASMVVARLQRATIGMVVMVMSAITVRRRSQTNDGLPQARTRAEQAGQRRRWWPHLARDHRPLRPSGWGVRCQAASENGHTLRHLTLRHLRRQAEPCALTRRCPLRADKALPPAR